MGIPSDYKAGYEKARLVCGETADNYVAHTLVGDPVMDAAVVELASLPQDQVEQFIRAGMDEDREAMRNAPQLLPGPAGPIPIPSARCRRSSVPR